MSVDFGMAFGKAKQVSSDEIHMQGRSEPHALLLVNQLSMVSFTVKLTVDGIYKGEFQLGRNDGSKAAGDPGSHCVYSLLFTCDPEMEPHADDEKVVWYRDATVTKRVEAEFTPSVGNVLTITYMVRFE